MKTGYESQPQPRQTRSTTARQRVPSWRAQLQTDDQPQAQTRPRVAEPPPAPTATGRQQPPLFILILLFLALVLGGMAILRGGDMSNNQGPPSPSPVQTELPLANTTGVATPGQYRAFWVDAFHDGFKTHAQTTQLIHDVQAAHMNMIVVQVSKRGDAYYQSDLQPRAEDAPAYDALADLIAQAHAATPRIEVHAWLATLPIWTGTTPPRDPNHVFNTHGPTASSDAMWLTLNKEGKNYDGTNYVLDPGHPDALRWVVDRYLEVVRKYDVDGIHMDLVRYSGQDWGYNPVALARYKAAVGLPANAPAPAPSDERWSQWRRDQVTALVRQIYIRAIAIKPQIKVSAALIPWGDGPSGEDGFAQTSAYREVMQDWAGWWREGIIDIVMPMNYDRQANASQARYYQNWLDWEKSMRNKYGRHLIPGPGIYLNSPTDAIAQIRQAISPGINGDQADGVALYSYAVTNNSTLSTAGFVKLLAQGDAAIFNQTSPVPAMPWKEHPTTGSIMGEAPDGTLIQVSGPNIQQTAKADASGWWGLTNLPSGTYQIAVSGGTPASVTITAGKVSEVK